MKRHKRKILAVSMIIIFIIIAVFITNKKDESFEVRYGITDRGVKQAIKNNYIQDVDISEEHDGIIVTADNIIIDGSRILIFYNIESNIHRDSYKYLSSVTYNIMDENGSEIPAILEIPDYNFNLDTKKKLYSHFDMILSPQIDIPSNIQLDINLKVATHSSKSNNKGYSNKSVELPYKWKMNIPIDKKIFDNKKRVYDLDKNIEIEGQKIIINKLTVYPTASLLDISFDQNNTMNILGLQDFKLVSDGEEYNNGIDGVSSSIIDGYNRVLYYESDYFGNDKEIYIKGSGIKVIDKSKADIIVDVENNKLLKSPDDNLELEEIDNYNDSYKIILKYTDKPFALASIFTDADGTIFDFENVAHNLREDYIRIIYQISNDVKFVNPITLKVNDYPTMINKIFKVDIN
ncbi:hypothetical protein AN1V17_37010 [Vallitalea sediminicola]